MNTLHKPVLLNEVLEYLNPQAGQNFIDCTLGGGGHTNAILNKIIPGGKVLAIDLDKEAINRFKSKVKSQKSKVLDNLILVNDNFVNLEKIIVEHNFSSVDGILVDFGFSSDQIENSERGFSFLRDGPLDMRYDKNQESINSIKSKVHKVESQKSKTAEEIVNKWSQKELETIFREYGEEWMAGKIVSRIIEERKKIQLEQLCN